jgi:hypothetical protein
MSEPRRAILLRISPDLARELHLWARDEMRSVNAQIEYIPPDRPSDGAGAEPGPAGNGGSTR